MHYDHIIIGSGAGGAAAAYRLANAGRQVLLIEKGKALPRDGSTLDFSKVIGAGVFKSKEPWLDKDGQRFTPEEYFNLGGKTKWYGAALVRYGRNEFDADPEFQCLSWPIAYDDLAPYYAEVEQLLGVRHFDVEPDLQRILARIEREGSRWRAESLPLGLAPEILTHREEAGHFDGFASPQGFKADAQRAFLERVASHDNLHILTGQPVRKLLGDDSAPQRITGVLLENGNRYTGVNVFLAAGAMHSPRLLQRYLDESGLAQHLPCARVVGRYFKRHILTAMLALSPSRKTDLLRKTVVWLSDEFPHSSIQPLGFGSDVIASLLPGFVPGWLARQFGARAYGFFLQTEDGSDTGNRVIAEKPGAEGMDALPRLDYDAARLPRAVTEHKHMIRSFRRVLLKAGMVSFVKPIDLAGTAHACGTLVTGKDPRASVVDDRGKVHGLENLYVVDGSILPRSSRVNPALTIYAWALRVASLLLAKEGT